MQYVFPRTQFRVELDRRGIAEIRLHIDDIRPTRTGDHLELLDERRGDPLPPVCSGDSEIVDVDLAALLLELAKLVRRESTHDLTTLQSRDRDKGIATKQTTEIRLAWPGPAVRFRFVEGFSEHRRHAFHQGDVIGTEHSDRERLCGHTSRLGGLDIEFAVRLRFSR